MPELEEINERLLNAAEKSSPLTENFSRPAITSRGRGRGRGRGHAALFSTSADQDVSFESQWLCLLLNY